VERLEKKSSNLDRRVGALEEQVLGKPAASSETGAAGGAQAGEAEQTLTVEKERCPGCRLEVESLDAARCDWCGFIFSAMTL